MKNSSLLVGIILLGSIGTLLAGPLQEAKISQIVNDVKVVDPQKGARPAAVQDTVRDQIAVRTGIQSRAELLFQDATLTRLGAETFFSFKAGTRDLSLERGTLLLQVPKNRGGARIRTASVTASITGTTIMIEHLPGSSLKVLVLEGSLRLSANNRRGESVNLKPGKMVIMKPDATKIPDPVDVDLRQIMKSSALVNPDLFSDKPGRKVAALPSIPLIEKEIARQDVQLEAKGLVRTNLVIPGGGTGVILASTELLANLDKGVVSRDGRSAGITAGGASATGGGSGEGAPSRGTAIVNTVPTGGGTTGGGTVPTGGGTVPAGGGTVPAGGGTVPAGGGTVPTGGGTVPTGGGTVPTGGGTVPTGGGTAPTGGGTLPTGGFEVINIPSLPNGQSLNRIGNAGLLVLPPSAGGAVELRGPQLEVANSKVNGINFTGGNGGLGLGQQGGDGGYLRVSDATGPIAGPITVTAPILATTGTNSLGVTYGGVGGTVELLADGEIVVKDRIEVSSKSGGRASRSGGNIALGSRATGTAIKIENSAQILSLLAAGAPGPGGTITFLATQGDIEVKDSTVQADRGMVQITTGSANGRILLENASIRGDAVKIGALGANGQLLIGGGTISADSMLKLYGGSSNGSVRFKDDVTLGGAGAKIIAGQTVTIDSGKTVSIGGGSPASVHTNSPNYSGSGGNGSTSGQFGGAGATTQSYGSRPAF